MTDSEKTTPGDPAGSVTAAADPASGEPADARPGRVVPVSAQPQTVALTDPTNLLPPMAPRPRPPAGDDVNAPGDDAPDDDAPGNDDPAAGDDEAVSGDDGSPAAGPNATTAPAARPAGPRAGFRDGWMVAAVTVTALVVAGGATALALGWPGAGGGPPPAASPPATTGAACLIGTWRSTQVVYGGVAATGTETLAFHGDGTGVDTLDRMTVSSDDGHTHMYDGTVMFRYIATIAIVNTTAPTGTLVDRDLTAETTRTATPAYEPRNFACSATSLTLTNGTDVSRFTRA